MAPNTAVVTGASGFLGKAVVLQLLGLGWTVQQWKGDLRDRHRTFASFATMPQPDVVIHLAKPRSEGIQTMLDAPFGYTSDLLQMDLNVIEGVSIWWPSTRLICTGSVCAYPAHTDPPTREIDLWRGYPEPVNAPYGVSSRMQLELLNAAWRQYGLSSVHFLTANLYGPGDESKHVIPSLIRRMLGAIAAQEPVFDVWGGPDVSRSFLYVDDAAEAIVRMAEPQHFPGNFHESTVLNLAAPGSTSMASLVTELCDLLEYTPHEVRYDESKPTGHRHREFSVERLQQLLGWVAPTELREGLRRTIEWHKTYIPEIEI